MTVSSEQSDGNDEAWESVLASLFPNHSAGRPCGGRDGRGALRRAQIFSFVHDHVLPYLRERFGAVLAQLEAVAGWKTARRRPVLMLGSLDGVETDVRQLERTRPLETTTMRIGGHDVTVPTLREVIRIKAYLCVTRNATRDYLDLAALTSHMGVDAAAKALPTMDELYP